MLTVDFIHAADCPNVERARANLEAAFRAAGMPPRWLEWDVADAATPEEFRALGSPTILIDGRDIDAGATRASAGSCRVYSGPDGLSGVPSVERIAELLRGNTVTPTAALAGGSRWHGLAVVPSLGLAAVPVGLCPACFAGYLGIFGALGVGMLTDTRLLLPLMAVALAIALAPLAWRARRRRGFRPLLLGGAGAVLLLVGQFVLASPVALWLGAAALIAATLWHGWPLGRSADCADCDPRSRPKPQVY